MEEIDLIKRARQDDQAVWARLVEEHQEEIFRLAYLILGDPDDAKDVAQETFVRAFRSLDRFDEGRPLKPWLLQIAANLSRNQRRASGRYWAALTRLGLREIDEKRNTAEETSIREEKSKVLWAAVRQLRQVDQEVVYLRFFLDLSVDETAVVLEIAPGTVKSRLHRSLKRLETVISRDFPVLKEDDI